MSDCQTCGNTNCTCDDPCGDQDPCANLCWDDKVNPKFPPCTVCNLDTSNNIWFRPGYNGHQGACKLDQLTYGQVIRVLRTVPCAGADLLKITDDPCLVELANKVKLIVPEKEQNAILSKRMSKGSLPYYTLFKGNTGGSIH